MLTSAPVQEVDDPLAISLPLPSFLCADFGSVPPWQRVQVLFTQASGLITYLFYALGQVTAFLWLDAFASQVGAPKPHLS